MDGPESKAGTTPDPFDEGKSKRTVSTIDFPYSDLDSAIDLARTLLNRGGNSAEVAELAGWMDQTASGGTFKSRVSAARHFGLVTPERGRITITPLGRDILDAAKERVARVTAFLNVPLYSAMYEQYKGYALPPAPAIQRQMIDMGVSPKQAERARQTFSKSATEANFIDPGTGRFVKPGVGPAEPAPAPAENPSETPRNSGGGAGGGDGGKTPIDPIIQGLINRLPPSGSSWPKAKRKLWLQILESSFDLVYVDGAEGDADKLLA